MADAAAERNRRIGRLSVLASLFLVFVFWTLIVPHTPQYKTYKREARLKKALRSIPPPADATPGEIRITTVPGIDYRLALGVFTSKSDCATVEAHYKAELPKHGFAYTGENEASPKADRSLSFSSQEYGAQLTCHEIQGARRVYFVTISSNAHD